MVLNNLHQKLMAKATNFVTLQQVTLIPVIKEKECLFYNLIGIDFLKNPRFIFNQNETN